MVSDLKTFVHKGCQIAAQKKGFFQVSFALLSWDFFVSLLLSASVERFFVSRMRDFFLRSYWQGYALAHSPVHHINKPSPALQYVWFGWHWGLGRFPYRRLQIMRHTIDTESIEWRGSKKKLNFFFWMLPATTCHLSHVTFHLSYVTCCMSPV